MPIDAATTTLHGFPLTMNGDPMVRACQACGAEFFPSHGESVGRFIGIRRSGAKASRPPQRFCSLKCAAKTLGESRVGVHAMRGHWAHIQATRTEKRCSQCHGVFPIGDFRLNKKQRKLRGECRKCRNANTVALYGKPARYLAVILSTAKARAKKASVPFELDRGWALQKLDEQGWRCWYSGVPMTIGGGNKSVCPTNVSIDRMDPALGYVRGNVVFCAAAVNIAKNIWTVNDLLAWSDKIRAWGSSNSRKEITQ